MNIQSLKQRLSLQNISETLLRVLKRFPVTTGLLVALTAVLSYLLATETEPGRKLLCLLAFMSAGIVISLATSLWGEEQRDQRRRWIVESVSLAQYRQRSMDGACRTAHSVRLFLARKGRPQSLAFHSVALRSIACQRCGGMGDDRRSGRTSLRNGGTL